MELEEQEKEKIIIESQEYDDRTEFRIKIYGKYPSGIGRKGMWTRYMSTWISAYCGGGQVDYIFLAYKKKNWFQKYVLNKTYDGDCIAAIKECEKLIMEYKQKNKQPKIQLYQNKRESRK